MVGKSGEWSENTVAPSVHFSHTQWPKDAVRSARTKERFLVCVLPPDLTPLVRAQVLLRPTKRARLDLARLVSQFDNEALSDCKLVLVDEEDDTSAPLHVFVSRMLLASQSSMLEKLFAGGMKETGKAEVVLKLRCPGSFYNLARRLFSPPSLTSIGPSHVWRRLGRLLAPRDSRYAARRRSIPMPGAR